MPFGRQVGGFIEVFSRAMTDRASAVRDMEDVEFTTDVIDEIKKLQQLLTRDIYGLGMMVDRLESI